MNMPFVKRKGDVGWAVFRADNFTAHRSLSSAKALAESFAEQYPRSKFWVGAVRIEAETEPQVKLPDYAATEAFGEELKLLMDPKDRLLQIEILPKDYDCNTGSFKVTVSDGEFQASATGCGLAGAIGSARHRLKLAREEVEPKIVEIKAGEAPPPPSPPRPKISAAGLSIKKKV